MNGNIRILWKSDLAILMDGAKGKPWNSLDIALIRF